jgi:rubrerythrin
MRHAAAPLMSGADPKDFLRRVHCYADDMTDKTGALRTRTEETPTTWQCLTCHFEVVDTVLPRKCPRCGASRVKFVEVGAQAENEA